MKTTKQTTRRVKKTVAKGAFGKHNATKKLHALEHTYSAVCANLTVALKTANKLAAIHGDVVEQYLKIELNK